MTQTDYHSTLKKNILWFLTLEKKIPPAKIKIYVRQEEIEQVQKCKFLGVILDSKLNWKDHLKYLSTKVAKTIGILGKAHKVFNKATLISLYYSFLKPTIAILCYQLG